MGIFANSWAWWGLGLALPVIAFYLWRQQVRPRRVSTLLFFRRDGEETKQIPFWRKFRRWISLLLQLLFLFLLLLALAKPQRSFYGETRSVVVLISPSLTLGAGDGAAWRWVQKEVEKEIDSMRDSDRVILVEVSDSPRILSDWSQSGSKIKKVLKSVLPNQNPQDPNAALAVAKSLIRKEKEFKIFWFTDGILSEPAREKLMEGVEIRYPMNSMANSGITLFQVKRSWSIPGDYELLIQLETNQEEVHGELEIMQDGRLLDVMSVQLSSNAPWRKSWRQNQSSESKFNARWIPHQPNDLKTDDEAKTHLSSIASLRVAVVGKQLRFIEEAIRVQPNLKAVYMERMNETDFQESWDLVLFDQTLPIESREYPAMILINPPSSGFWGTQENSVDTPVITEVNKEHFLMNHVGLEQVRIQKAQRWKLNPGTEVFASSLEAPLIFGKWREGRRWLVLGFPLEDSDLVFRTSFPILFSNALESLRASHSEVIAEHVLPGSRATRFEVQKFESKISEETQIKSLVSSGFHWGEFWRLLLIVAIAWIYLEWRLYHRRITE